MTSYKCLWREPKTTEPPTFREDEDALVSSRSDCLAELCDLGVANVELEFILDEPSNTLGYVFIECCKQTEFTS